MEKLQRVVEQDRLFDTTDTVKIWSKYCGFLDLSIEEFNVMQKALLMDQLRLITESELGRKIMRGRKPKNLDEFRRDVPLTSYEDYEPYLSAKREDVLGMKPVIWARTSGRTGFIKWTPYAPEHVGNIAEDIISAAILSAATRKGEVLVHNGVKAVLNLPPVPYVTGIMGSAASQRIEFNAIPPLEAAERMEFQERIKEGFKLGLQTEIDFVASMGVVLVKVGESFGKLGSEGKIPVSSLHPKSAVRLLRGLIRSRLAGRPLLPRDLWKVKGLICGGTDSSIYRDQIVYYWGSQPLDAYVASETGFIAMQGWDKQGMSFLPQNNFFEFIPESESRRSREEPGYFPETLLIGQLEEGKIYEIVLTNFHGGPFLRYRIGDLIKIVALKNERTGVKMPQMVFHSRADDIIDMGGFARLDEKTIWKAVQNLGVPYADWSARKEVYRQRPVLHVYLELSRTALDSQKISLMIDQQLMVLDTDYRDFRVMAGGPPTLVTLLAMGTFEAYQREKQAAGHDLAHLKPRHMNAPDSEVENLLHLSQTPAAVR